MNDGERTGAAVATCGHGGAMRDAAAVTTGGREAQCSRGPRFGLPRTPGARRRSTPPRRSRSRARPAWPATPGSRRPRARTAEGSGASGSLSSPPRRQRPPADRQDSAAPPGRESAPSAEAVRLHGADYS